jgi:Predicted AAA-ATPase/PD-(D/E)XK nuclease superfamily
LIDEYDKPISDYIDPHNIEKAKKQIDILKKFFSILEDYSKYIRFLFITGISKFAKVSIFSELNHLVDLTLNPNCATMFGYTQTELEHYFKDYLEIMPTDTLEKMKYWYDGYSWDGNFFLYNPFSVLNFFDTREYRNYWFSTGTPTILMKLMHRRLEYQLEETEVSNLIMESFRIDNFENLNLNSLLLQTGYLTIKAVTEDNTYILNYPNEEVRQSFAQFLLSEYTTVEVTSTYQVEILRALRINDLERVRRVIHHLIQAIPDHNYIQNEEKFLHAVVHLIFTMVGTDVRSEVHTPAGRIDTIVVTTNRIFLFEFKMDESADAALKCIEDRNYVSHLRHRNKAITAIGVSFDSQKKGIGDWKAVEVLKM